MVTFICPTCGEERTGMRRRCYPCTKVTLSDESRERIRQTLTGVKHSEERRRANSEGHKGNVNRFSLGDLTRGKPSPRAVPPGTERIAKKGRVEVKCADGKWRYRARLVWEAANGPIPRGRIIHHDNEDPMDDRLENLRMVTRAEHARIHSTPDVARERQRRAVEARKQNGSY